MRPSAESEKFARTKQLGGILPIHIAYFWVEHYVCVTVYTAKLILFGLR